MTRDRLDRYPALLREIRQLEGYIADAEKNGAPLVADTVQSSAAFPYAMHSEKVEGRDYALLRRWRDTLAADRKERDEIRAFIESVPDEQVRIALRYKCYDDLPWQTIAMRMGWQDWRAPKNLVEKFCAM